MRPTREQTWNRPFPHLTATTGRIFLMLPSHEEWGFAISFLYARSKGVVWQRDRKLHTASWDHRAKWRSKPTSACDTHRTYRLRRSRSPKAFILAIGLPRSLSTKQLARLLIFFMASRLIYTHNLAGVLECSHVYARIHACLPLI